jgi:hypothetical protein
MKGERHRLSRLPRYNLNIVESGIKHHQKNKQTNFALAKGL